MWVKNRAYQWYVTLVAINGSTLLVPYLQVRSLQFTWGLDTCIFHLQLPDLQMSRKYLTTWQGTRIKASWHSPFLLDLGVVLLTFREKFVFCRNQTSNENFKPLYIFTRLFWRAHEMLVKQPLNCKMKSPVKWAHMNLRPNPALANFWGWEGGRRSAPGIFLSAEINIIWMF